MFLSVSQWALAAFSILAIALLILRGKAPERIAAVAFAVAALATPLLSPLHVGDLRWGVALVEVALAATLIFLCFKSDRWWLLAAAGIQLIAPITFALASTNLDVQVWAAVSVRLAVWLQLMLVALFGVLESRRAPYARSTSVS